MKCVNLGSKNGQFKKFIRKPLEEPVMIDFLVRYCFCEVTYVTRLHNPKLALTEIQFGFITLIAIFRTSCNGMSFIEYLRWYLFRVIKEIVCSQT